MRKTAVLAFLVALAPQVATAHVVRHSSIPEAYWGTWAPGSGACKESDKSAIVLSAKAYVGPAGNCAVESVSETPGPNGAVYSARMKCSAPGGQAQKKTSANLIIRPGTEGRISAGPAFNSLTTYSRCSASAAGSKQ